MCEKSKTKFTKYITCLSDSPGSAASTALLAGSAIWRSSVFRMLRDTKEDDGVNTHLRGKRGLYFNAKNLRHTVSLVKGLTLLL